MEQSDPRYPCRAFVIDPFVLIAVEGRLKLSSTPPIQEVSHDGSIDDIYRRISTPNRRVDMMEACYIDGSDCMYVDEEGLLHGDASHFILVEGFPNPVAGKGIVLGTDSEGYSISPTTSIEALWRRVSIAVGNVEVRLSDLDVGSPVTADAVRLHPEMTAKIWAQQTGVW